MTIKTKKIKLKNSGDIIYVKVKPKKIKELCGSCDRQLTDSELLFNGLCCNQCISQRRFL